MIEIIGISGKANSGKSTIAKKYFLPRGFVSLPLAVQFKIDAIANEEATFEEVFHTKPPAARKLFQLNGTDGRRVRGNDIWVKYNLAWIEFFSEFWDIHKFIVDDIRYPNEVEFIQQNGGQVFRLISPKRIEKSPLTEEARLHESETALDSYTLFDGIIFNDPEYEETISRQITNLLGEPFIVEDDPEDASWLIATFKNFFGRND